MVDIIVQTHEIIYEIVKMEIAAQEYIFVLSNCTLRAVLPQLCFVRVPGVNSQSQPQLQASHFLSEFSQIGTDLAIYSISKTPREKYI